MFCCFLQSELQALSPGQVVERVPAKPNQRSTYDGDARNRPRPDPYEGTWEVLILEENQTPVLDRHDVWGWPSSGSSSRPPGMMGFRLDS